MEEDISTARYCFKGEWKEVENCKVTEFLITYFPGDSSIELFDLKKHRLFLKRNKCHQVALKDLFVGNSVNIFSRQITITDYGDSMTKQRLSIKMQKTFGLLQSNQIKNLGPILEAIQEGGFTIGRMRMISLTREQALVLFKNVKEAVLQNDLVTHTISGPVVVLELLGNNAIQSWADFIGPMDPEEAKRSSPTSLIAKYGHDCSRNGFFASNISEEVEHLLSLFFPERCNPQHQVSSLVANIKNCTCCIVKPHAFQMGLLGPIVSSIQKAGFEITGLRLVLLDHSAAEEFLEIYSTVLPEFPAMVTQLCSGSCVAMEICGKGDNTPTQFREFVGPSDPEIAKKLRPNSLRARFGVNKIQNAVHCTDLPDDAELELEYFFRLL
ncbi:nucleoside diphosphate kinase 7 [Frankliniella occidentalis]|uniref:Nucleoside diphosphate kinase 7 n=1 Tax=Frankliniella occidentalis TaxID=133901 RepID=A0A6J1SQN0_FRAOC|nr:nucleoside diphosphate kinase 7 [Frankliniella occidentalis]